MSPIIYPAKMLSEGGRGLGWLADYSRITSLLALVRDPILEGRCRSSSVYGASARSSAALLAWRRWPWCRLQRRLIFISSSRACRAHWIDMFGARRRTARRPVIMRQSGAPTHDPLFATRLLPLPPRRDWPRGRRLVEQGAAPAASRRAGPPRDGRTANSPSNDVSTRSTSGWRPRRWSRSTSSFRPPRHSMARAWPAWCATWPPRCCPTGSCGCPTASIAVAGRSMRCGTTICSLTVSTRLGANARDFSTSPTSAWRRSARGRSTFLRSQSRRPATSTSRTVLESFGITLPFVLCQASDDEKTSIVALMTAIERLDATRRNALQFVIACKLNAPQEIGWNDYIRHQGLTNRVLLIRIDHDETARLL